MIERLNYSGYGGESLSISTSQLNELLPSLIKKNIVSEVQFTDVPKHPSSLLNSQQKGTNEILIDNLIEIIKLKRSDLYQNYPYFRKLFEAIVIRNNNIFNKMFGKPQSCTDIFEQKFDSWKLVDKETYAAQYDESKWFDEVTKSAFEKSRYHKTFPQETHAMKLRREQIKKHWQSWVDDAKDPESVVDISYLKSYLRKAIPTTRTKDVCRQDDVSIAKCEDYLDYLYGSINDIKAYLSGFSKIRLKKLCKEDDVYPYEICENELQKLCVEIEDKSDRCKNYLGNYSPP